MAKSILLIFFMICASSFAMVVKYRDCGSKEGKAFQVSVSPCSSAPCALIRGKNSSIDILFAPSHDVQKVTVHLVGVIASLPVPFPLPHPDACSYPPSQLVCPLKGGKEQHYHLELPVRKQYPKLKLEAKVYLMDENSQTLICVEIPVEIKDGIIKN